MARAVLGRHISHWLVGFNVEPGNDKQPSSGRCTPPLYFSLLPPFTSLPS